MKGNIEAIYQANIDGMRSYNGYESEVGKEIGNQGALRHNEAVAKHEETREERAARREGSRLRSSKRRPPGSGSGQLMNQPGRSDLLDIVNQRVQQPLDADRDPTP